MDDISAQSDNYTMEENMCERHFLDKILKVDIQSSFRSESKY